MFMGNQLTKNYQKKRGTTKEKLQYHLAEQWFRSTIEKNGASVFQSILDVIKEDSKFNTLKRTLPE
jgi:nitrate/TMAO reductase-like tetraheme cytochrome c subunit